MKHKIIADSCCDMTPELRARLDVTNVPLNIMLGDAHYTDDDSIDLPAFMADMAACTGKIGTAAPSPLLYKEAFATAESSFGITLSSRLSGSHSSAVNGKALLEEESDNDVYVFDSKSAAAGEVLVALELHRLIEKGEPKPTIIASIEEFIKNMKTYFVLDNVDNLLKSGRLNKVVGKVITFLNIRPIMGSDGDGSIALFGTARGQNQIIEKLVNLVKKSDRDTKGKSMVITHCCNLPLAERLRQAVEQAFTFAEILVVPTRALSSFYANAGGIVLAF